MASRLYPQVPHPMQYASGYTLDLYCDSVNLHSFREFPHIFNGEKFSECVEQARRFGWVVRTNSRTATCPKCSGKITVGEHG